MVAKRDVPGYLSIPDAAKETGLSEGFWRKAVFGKRISYYKIGRRVKIARRDLDLWIEARRIPAREIRSANVAKRLLVAPTRDGPPGGGDRE
jgi:excisionase family DNA binding protein